MCTPGLALATGLSQGALAFQTASTLFSIVGFVTQGQAARAQGQAAAQAAGYQASIARRNQIIANRAAEDALARGEAAKGRKELQTRQFISRQRTAQAGQGQKVDVGSALELVQDTAQFGKLDALQIRANAEREALGFRTQGLNFGSSAELMDLRARNALLEGDIGFKAGLFGAGKSLIKGAKKFA